VAEPEKLRTVLNAFFLHNCRFKIKFAVIQTGENSLYDYHIFVLAEGGGKGFIVDHERSTVIDQNRTLNENIQKHMRGFRFKKIRYIDYQLFIKKWCTLYK